MNGGGNRLARIGVSDADGGPKHRICIEMRPAKDFRQPTSEDQMSTRRIDTDEQTGVQKESIVQVGTPPSDAELIAMIEALRTAAAYVVGPPNPSPTQEQP